LAARIRNGHRRSRNGWWKVRRFLVVFVVIVAAGAAALWWLKFEPGPPTAAFERLDEIIGRRTAFEVVARAQGRPGLRRVEVRLRAGAQVYELLSADLDEGVREQRFAVEADLRAAGVSQGPGQIEVLASTDAWHVLPPRPAPVATRTVMIDLTPPTVALLSIQHNVRLGGSGVAVFRVGEDTARAGVVVGDYFFPAIRGFFADPAIAVALFAVPQDLSADVQPKVHVADGVGNEQEAVLPSRIRPRAFPERQLDISDGFLQRKVPEIFTAIGKPPPADLVEGYLYLNRDLRRESELRIQHVTAESASKPLWDGTFRRQSNAAPMSAFADRRVYLHNGRIIDRQTHLGYDLASLQRASVEATQNGVVVFADYLGIYGNTVILDHGMGVFSLYGHLSTFAVQLGQKVKAGESLGQTGETGLAGGDHLHFSIMLRGVHVDPVEWWDGKWIRDHVTAKLSMFPTAAAEEASSAPEADAADRASEAEALAENPTDGQAEP
jgi:murein DD-endopeptidase MepM/ murein hydrolase activator NlpD